MQTSMEPANGLNGSKHRKMATMLSIIPGVGQMYNKQFVKGLIFLVLTGSFIVAFADLLNMGLWGIVTLGTEVPRDHSVFLLVEGSWHLSSSCLDSEYMHLIYMMHTKMGRNVI